MRYLGRIRGAGFIKSNGDTMASVHYDLDGYLMKPGHVTGSGEIRMAPEALRQALGRNDLSLLTEDGRLLSLRFSEKLLPEASETAHVDVSGELPAQAEWRN
ncbi:hypothetical protein DUT91_21515 [Phyllobacterium salinisoli]|uniref:Uncharacterized protein n=1 Tax=Phyllobacterium salinisoli TaxID=1899321 RepID=A0A368JYA1_9HYPH|nr:hypothetical protein [Phyllobacterium salinisoli]RCS21884.1 hypothetical protein DUT91_21515 [Phyllobacterium salinisoli]